MNTSTLSVDPVDFGNKFPSSDVTSEPTETSRTKGETVVFSICSEFLRKQFADILVGSTSPAASVGQYLVDPSKEIQNSKSLETLIAIARWISEEIADSLSEIHSYPLDEDELPLNLTSAKNFLRYSFAKGLNKPILTATRDGLLQADWDNEEGPEMVAIRFLAENKVWVTTQTEEMRGTVEVELSSLLADRPPLNLPSWANE